MIIPRAFQPVIDGHLDSVCHAMYYERPRFNLNQVDKAGVCVKNLASPHDMAHALEVPFNYRAAHSFPLNAFYTTLRRRAKKIDSRALTAQRLKRFESIFRKLNRRDTMQLSQMQDIGGCRAIVHGVKQLRDLVDLYNAKPLTHSQHGMKDYTKEPKDDGYRSTHLMYRFVGTSTSRYWDKLRIEIQMRTKLQHAWSPAVETVDTFTGEDLKFGLGGSDWRRFFQLGGSAHAALEGGAFVPNTPANQAELKDEMISIEEKLNITPLLRSWSHITKQITGVKGGKDYWYLIEVRPSEGKVYISSFSAKERDDANKKYQSIELANKGSLNQAVLVSVNSLRNLQKTYPNYFADTEFFLESLASFLGRSP